MWIIYKQYKQYKYIDIAIYELSVGSVLKSFKSVAF